MTSEKLMYGWYSEKQKTMNIRYNLNYNTGHPISNIYIDFKGNQVEITQVCSRKNDFNINFFDDGRFVGLVVDWHKSIYV